LGNPKQGSGSDYSDFSWEIRLPSRAVTWRTDKTVTKAVAQIAEATVNSKFTSDNTEIDAVTEPFDLGQYKRNSSLIVHYHSVRFQGLKPDTLYVYRVGDGSKALV
jgi:hypothetical protein